MAPLAFSVLRVDSETPGRPVNSLVDGHQNDQGWQLVDGVCEIHSVTITLHETKIPQHVAVNLATSRLQIDITNYHLLEFTPAWETTPSTNRTTNYSRNEELVFTGQFRANYVQIVLDRAFPNKYNEHKQLGIRSIEIYGFKILHDSINKNTTQEQVSSRPYDYRALTTNTAPGSFQKAALPPTASSFDPSSYYKPSTTADMGGSSRRGGGGKPKSRGSLNDLSVTPLTRIPEPPPLPVCSDEAEKLLTFAECFGHKAVRYSISPIHIAHRLKGAEMCLQQLKALASEVKDRKEMIRQRKLQEIDRIQQRKRSSNHEYDRLNPSNEFDPHLTDDQQMETESLESEVDLYLKLFSLSSAGYYFIVDRIANEKASSVLATWIKCASSMMTVFMTPAYNTLAAQDVIPPSIYPLLVAHFSAEMGLKKTSPNNPDVEPFETESNHDPDLELYEGHPSLPTETELLVRVPKQLFPSLIHPIISLIGNQDSTLHNEAVSFTENILEDSIRTLSTNFAINLADLVNLLLPSQTHWRPTRLNPTSWMYHLGRLKLISQALEAGIQRKDFENYGIEEESEPDVPLPSDEDGEEGSMGSSVNRTEEKKKADYHVIDIARYAIVQTMSTNQAVQDAACNLIVTLYSILSDSLITLLESSHITQSVMDKITARLFPSTEPETVQELTTVNYCELCGRVNFAWTSISQVIEHQRRECPMTATCTFCRRLVRIDSFASHLLFACDKQEIFRVCSTCGEPVLGSEYDSHKKEECQPSRRFQKQAREQKSTANAHQLHSLFNKFRCILCHTELDQVDEAWLLHLNVAPGCPHNPHTRRWRKQGAPHVSRKMTEIEGYGMVRDPLSGQLVVAPERGPVFEGDEEEKMIGLRRERDWDEAPPKSTKHEMPVGGVVQDKPGTRPKFNQIRRSTVRGLAKQEPTKEEQTKWEYEQNQGDRNRVWNQQIKTVLNVDEEERKIRKENQDTSWIDEQKRKQWFF
ncbi:hypothetical protein BLNAU_21308 [Blattamonas nauphoetae]|uniref:Uncharacterized protein n=1 Tax=Blattamonas nauphoetae TaxID=2049346 RepID=A0ABQ9WWB0_9EUKA|nr:hypothetical protein BLNAU_21308 [Blattamonas nauphoetae]